MKRKLIFRLILSAILLIPPAIHAQVTIGSDIPPTRGALLDIKTRQSSIVIATVGDDDNISTDEGGILLPRVKLVSTTTLQPFVDLADADWMDVDKQKALRMSLVGLTVYNIATVGNPLDPTLYPALYTWDGTQWTTSQANASAGIAISIEPAAFTFYETGTEMVNPLEFSVSGGVPPITYQWYQVTGNNVHIRIGTKVGQSGTIYTTTSAANVAGANLPAFIPQAVIKGTTMDANNTGFYKFYCEATDANGVKLQSATAEVAVGCGAKNNTGEWISFMCFNLGATVQTIDAQKNYPMTFSSANDADGKHYYIDGEENLYGDLYQWGRIGDGHEKRGVAQGFTPGTQTSGNQVPHGTTGPAFENGNILGTASQAYPWNQVARTDADFYGRFITTGSAQNYNWAYNLAAASIDQIWRTGRFEPNDPCAKINADGLTYMTYYPETSSSTAGGSATTAWRTPSQHEWGEIYKGGTISGSPGTATANTWIWNSTNGRGYEIKPDGVTTTLFLPASGSRYNNNGLLYHQGNYGNYWSISVLSTSAYNLSISSSTVNPVYSYRRGNGFALRCIKNN